MENVEMSCKQVKEALNNLLMQTGIFKPPAEFGLYEIALKLFVTKSNMNDRVSFLNEAMHEIYAKKARSNLNWVDDVEALTYEVYNEMMNQ